MNKEAVSAVPFPCPVSILCIFCSPTLPVNQIGIDARNFTGGWLSPRQPPTRGALAFYIFPISEISTFTPIITSFPSQPAITKELNATLAAVSYDQSALSRGPIGPNDREVHAAL